MKKVAVVLLNLGGPDCPEAIEPFLFNLFNDRAIIGAPSFIRWIIARWVSKKRAPIAQEIYKHLGGRSPLLSKTDEQREALETFLNTESPERDYKIFIAMRYWHPMSIETAGAVKEYNPDNIVLLPLYPQFSTATTGSSIDDWNRSARVVGITVPTQAICCFPTNDSFVNAHANLISKRFIKSENRSYEPRLLFSAHGLPKKVVARGDPYQWQVEQTVQSVVKRLNETGIKMFSWSICYQSRVGPLEWIGPSTEDEIKRAGIEGVPVVVIPIAFVSEHSETLVELDIEYRDLANAASIVDYYRVPALSTHPEFIRGLASMVRDVLKSSGEESKIIHENCSRICPVDRLCCPQVSS